MPRHDQDRQDAPGAAIAVLRRGHPPDFRASGLARLEPRTAIAPDTNFRLASITKQFTARIVDLLVGDGAFALDTPIRRFLPALPAWSEHVRIGHLVAHTSGVVPYETLIPPEQTTQVTDRDVVRLLAGAPDLRFPPGSRFQYDNGGYALLAVIAELAAGCAFPDLLDDRVFRPLGMGGTVAHVEGRSVVPRRALGYRATRDGWVDADQGVASAVLGDGGIYSSVRDLARWDAALREPGGLPDPEALAPFSAPVQGPSASPGTGHVRYGFGWFLDRFEGRRRQRHEGWSTGFQNEIQRFPDDGVTVIVLTNRAEPPARPRAETLAREALAREAFGP